VQRIERGRGWDGEQWWDSERQRRSRVRVADRHQHAPILHLIIVVVVVAVSYEQQQSTREAAATTAQEDVERRLQRRIPAHVAARPDSQTDRSPAG